LRKLTVLLAALSMMMVMLAPPVMAAPGGNSPCHCQGNQPDDGLDPDQGGGNDHIKQNSGGGNDQGNW
jgi:hypothetical protein